ncbi:MAG: hypothetical protein AAFA34_02120 [Thermoplasmata archaeon]
MSEPADTLHRAAERLEPELRRRLSGFIGQMAQAYLPQTWLFETEAGSASLTVTGAGRITVQPGPLPAPDVTIRIAQSHLVQALDRPSGGSLPPGAAQVTGHTAKGRAAFEFLRGRLGL